MTLNALERMGFAMSGQLPEMMQADQQQTQRSALQALAQDPNFIKSPVNEQIEKIMAVTGDPTTLQNYQTQQQDPLRQAELKKSQAELENIHLQQSRLTQLSKMFGGDGTAEPALPGATGSNPVPGTGPSALVNYGKMGGMSVPPVASLDSVPTGPAPAPMPGPPGSMGPSALSSLAMGPPAPGAAVAPPNAPILPPQQVDNEDPAVKAMKAVVEQSRRAALIDPQTYGPSYLANQAKLAELQKTQAESVITPDNQGLIGQGKKFIDTIPNQAVQIQAQRYMNADDPPLVPNSRTPLVQKQAWAAAQAADPTLSSMSYPAKKQAKLNYEAGGTGANNVLALNTLIAHAGRAFDHSNSLPDHDFSVENTIQNYVGQKSNKDTRTALGALATDVTGVSTEAAKAYKGVGALSAEETRDWGTKLSPSVGKTPIQGNIKEIVHLVAGKVAAMNDQWNQAFPNQPKNFLSPASIKVLEKLGIDPSEFGTAAADDGVANIMQKAKDEIARRAAAKGKAP